MLRAAEKYNLVDLVEICVEYYFKSGFSLDTVLDVLVVADLINQEELFDAATDFVMKNKGKVVKTKDWKQWKETNPSLIVRIYSKMLDL